MNKVIVTPAGRKRYLEILFKHLKKQKTDFDEWQLWMNTTNQEDIDYCKDLAAKYEWITAIPLDIPHNGSGSIFTFFKYAMDENSVYLRFDDDVVWLEKDFIKKIFDFRISNVDPFLVYGNIVNNAVIDHIHQRLGAWPADNKEFIGYSCMDRFGWEDSNIAEKKHRNLLPKIKNKNLSKFKFSSWQLHYYERVSINVISWLGNEFAKFNGQVGEDEEQWLSVEKPQQLGRPNVIFGESLCAHFSFYTQRNHLDKTNILEQYNNLA